jgi:hypothetical protein
MYLQGKERNRLGGFLKAKVQGTGYNSVKTYQGKLSLLNEEREVNINEGYVCSR